MARRRHTAVRPIAAVLGVLAAALIVTSSAAAAPQPFGHSCTAQNGVRFCPTANTSQRIPTFDGVPLDADVTLPANGNGPFPTIVMMHGYGGSKTNFESNSPAGHYSNNYYAKQGYAVLTYSARGWGSSCGGGPSGDHSGPCGQGYIRLADTRYEARDTQYLLGLLADQGITKPKSIGVTGVSYGGGQSMELAFLRDKIRKTDGTLAPWRSPMGKAMQISAAYPRWPWSDLIDALLPNGRYLDTQVAPFKQSLNPVGVPIQSYIGGLYALGQISGYYCGGAPASSPCTNSEADITTDLGYTQAGRPLSPMAKAALTGFYLHSDAYPIRFLNGHSKPAPLLIQNGWTDDLFPPSQALRIYNYVRAAYGPSFPVSLQFGDLGHSRGSNKAATNLYFADQASQFFGSKLKGSGNGPGRFGDRVHPDLPPVATRRRAVQGRHAGERSRPGMSPSGAPVPRPSPRQEGTPRSRRRSIRSPGPRLLHDDLEDQRAQRRDLQRTSRRLHDARAPQDHRNVAATGQFGQIDARLWDISPGTAPSG